MGAADMPVDVRYRVTFYVIIILAITEMMLLTAIVAMIVSYMLGGMKMEATQWSLIKSY